MIHTLSKQSRKKGHDNKWFFWELSQEKFTYSKSTIETPEQGVKKIRINNKGTRTTSRLLVQSHAVVMVFLLFLFHTFF